jgi:hypothetical protein
MICIHKTYRALFLKHYLEYPVTLNGLIQIQIQIQIQIHRCAITKDRTPKVGTNSSSCFVCECVAKLGTGEFVVVIIIIIIIAGSIGVNRRDIGPCVHTTTVAE